MASWRTMGWPATALMVASAFILACSSGGSAEPKAATTSPPTEAPGEAAYRLHPASGGWVLKEAYNPTPERTVTAVVEPTLDWYAEYGAPPPASPRHVRLSGHGGTVDEVVAAMKGFRFEPARVGTSDGLAGTSPDAAGPAVVVFPARPDYSLMTLSYELSADELIAWSEELVPVTEPKWIKAGGRVDR